MLWHWRNDRTGNWHWLRLGRRRLRWCRRWFCRCVRPLTLHDIVVLLTPTTHEIVYHVADLVDPRIQTPDFCMAILYVPTMPVVEVPQIAHNLANLVDGR